MTFETAFCEMKKGRTCVLGGRAYRWSPPLESFEDFEWRPTILPLNMALLGDWTLQSYCFNDMLVQMKTQHHAISLVTKKKITRYEVGLRFAGLQHTELTFTLDEIAGQWEIL